MAFSDRMKELRKARGLTQQQIADLFHMSTRNFQKIEATNSPSYETLIRFADFYDVSTDYILGRSDDPTRR